MLLSLSPRNKRVALKHILKTRGEGSFILLLCKNHCAQASFWKVHPPFLFPQTTSSVHFFFLLIKHQATSAPRCKTGPVINSTPISPRGKLLCLSFPFAVEVTPGAKAIFVFLSRTLQACTKYFKAAFRSRAQVAEMSRISPVLC